MQVKKRVLIVDDHPLFRDGLKSLIARSATYEVAGEAGTGKEAVSLATELRPELVTMDISLPDMSGMDAAREIAAALPETKILMVSMHARYEYISEAFKAGARGYVLKEATADRLIHAMDALCRGEFFLDGQVSQEVITRFLTAPVRETVVQDEKYSLLSPREQQVLRLVAEGKSSREIAAALDITPKTVENHRANLMKRLDIHSKMELVRYAAKLGIIDVELWKE